MPRPSVRAAVASIVLAAAAAMMPAAAYGLAAPGTVRAAAEEGAPATDTGRIEIPYGEPGDIRPSTGWSIDCDAVEPVEGVELECLPDGLTLQADYDPAFGEQILPLTLRAGAREATVQYRLALAPPAPIEVGAATLDIPLTVGAQALVPYSVLELTCGLCAEASVRIDGVEPTTTPVGVGPGHLAVRPLAPGRIAVTVTFTDDAGQEVSGEIDLFATAAPVGDAGTGAAPRALHALTPEREVDLTTLAWGDDLTLTCLGSDPRVTCSPEGVARLADDADGAVQVPFRVVDGLGRQALGSASVDPDAENAPAAVSWADQATIALALPAPPADDEADAVSPLAPLARLIQEVPAS
jgi:hypothetical protein